MLYQRSFRLSVLFLSTLIHLPAQLAHPQTRDPWDEIQYRQPAGVRGPLDDPSIRDFVVNQTMLGPTDQPVNRPISGTVSVSHLRHQVPPKAQHELARSEREFRQGHLQSSVEHLKKAIAIDPAYMAAHNNLGARYIALGDNQRAVEHLETALRLDPSSAFAQLNVSLALYFLKRSDQAEQYARNAIRLTPGLPKAHYLLGPDSGNSRQKYSGGGRTPEKIRRGIPERPPAGCQLASAMWKRWCGGFGISPVSVLATGRKSRGDRTVASRQCTVAALGYDVTPAPGLPSLLETTSSARIMASARSRMGLRSRRLSLRSRR